MLLRLEPKATSEDWGKRFAEETDYHTLIDEPAVVSKADGSPLCILLRREIPEDVILQTWRILKGYNVKTENRGTASGISARPRIRMDGTKSKTTRVPKGWEVGSGVAGAMERTVRFPYAHHCSWNAKFPDRFRELFPLTRCVDDLFSIHLPVRYAIQRSYADKTHPAWLIDGTVFSTITINKNFRTAVHKDAGDLADGFGAMFCIRDGLFQGGHLVFPEYKIGVNLRHGDLILFDPHEFHGNTQIVKINPKAQRCTMVFYMREKIHLCGSPEAELQFAKNRKPGDPLY